MMWVGVSTLVAVILLVGLGFAAFWPTFPPIDDTPIPSWMLDEEGQERHPEALPERPPPRHRRRRNRQGEPRAAEVDEFLEVIREAKDEPPANLTPMEPTAETWMWSAGGAPAQHRWEHVGQETRPLEWPGPPAREGGPPEWPPRNRQ
jgi:hypothetical protein